MTTPPTLSFQDGHGPSTILAFSDLPLLKGRKFVGEWWSVLPEKLAEFDSATYADQMHNPWGEGSFPERLVEGFHLLSLLDYMMNAVLYPQGPEAFGWNYGLDRARFVSPIKADDRIRLIGTIAEVRTKDSGFLIRQDCVIEVEGRARPGFTAEWWVFWLPGVPSHD